MSSLALSSHPRNQANQPGGALSHGAHEAEASTRYLVRFKLNGEAHWQTTLWDAHSPLALGHPVSWVLENRDGMIRARNLSSTLGTIEKAVSLVIDPSGREVSCEGLIVKAKLLERAPSAFGSTSGAGLWVYSCLGRTIVSASPCAANGFIAPDLEIRVESTQAFRIGSKERPLILEIGGERTNLSPNGSVSLTREQLASCVVRAPGNRAWRFSFADAPEFQASATTISPEELREDKLFKRSFQASVLAVSALSLLVWMSATRQAQQPPTAEIPPQFAKIILSPAKKETASSSGSSGGAENMNKLPKKVQDTAVVRAFRSQQLAKSVRGLLKGGLTRLMAQSEFASGAKASAEAKRLFNTKNEALKPGAVNVGDINGREVQVAALGGEGVGGGAGGKGVGYGKGEHAGVGGQGKSFVSADLAASSVEEGLSKDEVAKVIHSHMSEVRYCYESAMVKRPDIEGKLMISFTIGGGGAVKVADIKSSTLPDPALDDCVMRRLKTWAFPKPKGGVDVAVTYPFIFKTLGR